MDATRPRWSRLLGVWLVSTVTPSALGRLLRPELTVWADARQATLVELLAATSAAVLLGCALWFWITVTTVSLSALRGRRLCWAGSPTWLRRSLVVACGLAVAGLPAAAHADSTLEQPGAVAGTSLEGMPVPDLPDTESQQAPRSPEAPKETEQQPAHAAAEPPRAEPDPAPRGASVVVRAGDTLWSIARGRSPTATDAQLSRLWREIWEANRDVIGDDPDVIHPGQRLDLGEEER